MATYTTSITPRLRVARDASFSTYDRSVSQIATATDVGPSHFPELSQLVDMDLDDISVSDLSERPSPSTSRAPNPSVSAAETLRSLMTRLDSRSLSPRPKDSHGHTSERESDYDMDLTEPAHAARSVVQESLRDIFTKARRDSGSTPQQAQPRSNNSSMDISNIASSLQTFSKEGRHNSSDNDLEDAHTSSHRPKTRIKYSPQPVTAEFLRERFSGSRILAESGGEDSQSYHYSAKDASGVSGDMSSFQTNLPVATSTPQQSLRMSFNSQFQSNLLDQDSEMQNAIRDLVSDDNSTHRSASPPSTIRKRAPLSTEYPTPAHGFDDVEDTSKTPMPIRHPHRPVSPISRPWPAQQAQSADMSDNAEFANGTSLMSERKQPTPPQSPSNQILGSSDFVKSSLHHSPPGSSGCERHRSRSKSPHTASFQWGNVYNSRPTRGVSYSQETHLRGDYSREQEIEVSRRSSRPGLSNHYETHESDEDDEEQGAHSHSGGVISSKVERNSFEVDANLPRAISRRNSISPHPSRTPSPRPSADQIAKTSHRSSPLTDQNSPPEAHPTVTRSMGKISDYKLPRAASAVRGNGKRTTVHSDEDDKNDDLHLPSATGSPQSIGTPRSNGKGHSVSQEIQESDWSPSTTPPRQTPKFRTRYLPLSPTNDPPDLPTPPSDSELENKSWNFDSTPRGNTTNGQEPSSLPTPKPPGGWLQTPAAPRQLSKPPTTPSKSSEAVKEEISDVDVVTEPETPMKNPYEERYPFKTPKPPGGWQTPATVTQRQPEPRFLEVEAGKSDQQLLTPVPSLSKGSAYNLRTPYVPGGWTVTPGTRKSVLKVRFNHELDSSYAQDGDDAHKQRVLDATPTARKPRHPATPHIRIVDSFGREHNNDSSRLSESVLPEGTVEDTVQHVSRSDLLSRIRRGFDDLVEDIEGTEDPDTSETREALFVEHAKIKELQAQSMQARRNRDYLLEQASKIRINPAPPIGTPSSAPLPAPSSHRRLYAILLLMQVFIILLMYRLSAVRAKSLFLSSYYDPFNPELYLYIFKHDTSFQLANADFSRTSQQSMGSTLLEGGARMWSCCRHVVDDAFSYFWTLWTGDAASRTTRLALT